MVKRRSTGKFYLNNANLGASTIDYSICSQNFYEYINNFMVLPQNELSDHCKIVTELKGSTNTETLLQDDYNWEILQNNFIWDDSLKALFTQNLENDLYKISDKTTNRSRINWKHGGKNTRSFCSNRNLAT